MTFGDHDPDDSYDPTAPPDPVQVARRHQHYRGELGDGPPWGDLTDEQRAVAVEVFRRLLAWMRRSGSLEHG